MNLITSLTISWDDIFEEEFNGNVSELLEGIPTKSSLEILSFFIAQIHTHERDTKKQIEFLDIWSKRLSEDIKKKISVFFSKIYNKNVKVNFINNLSCLYLIQHILSNSNELPARELSEEEETNLFKAYLLCSKFWIQNQPKPQSSVNTVDDINKMLLPVIFIQTELLEFKDFRPQFLKAAFLFEYFSTSEDYKTIIEGFLNNLGIENWNEYLYRLINIYINNLSTPSIPHKLYIPKESEYIKTWIDEISIDVQEFQSDEDFTSIRSKPLYKLDNDNYIFLNLNFLIDKLYQGVLFDIAKYIIQKKIAIHDKEIKTFLDFKNIYGDEIVESAIFNEIINYTFEKEKYIMLYESKLNDSLIGPPDFYIRDKSKVYLFEFKDTLISKGAKLSQDYDVISKELIKKFIENEKGKPKGLRQLYLTIQRLINKDFNLFDIKEYSNCIFYPIIIHQDKALDTLGVNRILYKESLKIKAEYKIERYNIKSPILINLDTLLIYQEQFRIKKIKLNNLLNGYLDYLNTNVKEEKIRPLTPFANYAKIRFDGIEFSSSKFDEILKKVIS